MIMPTWAYKESRFLCPRYSCLWSWRPPWHRSSPAGSWCPSSWLQGSVQTEPARWSWTRAEKNVLTPVGLLLNVHILVVPFWYTAPCNAIIWYHQMCICLWYTWIPMVMTSLSKTSGSTKLVLFKGFWISSGGLSCTSLSRTTRWHTLEHHRQPAVLVVLAIVNDLISSGTGFLIFTCMLTLKI